jgi:hypothetical protein
LPHRPFSIPSAFFRMWQCQSLCITT